MKIHYSEDMKALCFNQIVTLSNKISFYYSSGVEKELNNWFDNNTDIEDIKDVFEHYGLEKGKDYLFKYEVTTNYEVSDIGLSAVHIFGTIRIFDERHLLLVRLAKPEWFEKY